MSSRKTTLLKRNQRTEDQVNTMCHEVLSCVLCPQYNCQETKEKKMKKDGHQWSSGDDHYACRSYQVQAGGGEEKIHCHKGGKNIS